MEPTVRAARASDKGPLMGFIRDVWGGHDYIPSVWDSWLKDPRGKMFVVEADGVPVGMNRVQFLEDGSAWFEGARVHPEHRGRGLATMLGENSMKVAESRGVTVFRLTSGSGNKLAHRQIARIRFGEIARFSVYEPPRGRKRRDSGRGRKASVDELQEVVGLIEASREYRLGAGTFWHDFAAASLTHDVIRKLLVEGAVWRLGGAIAVYRAGAGGAWEEICFAGGPALDATALVKSLLGRNRKGRERWVFVPQGSPLIHALRTEGFKRNFAMVLFERRAANG